MQEFKFFFITLLVLAALVTNGFYFNKRAHKAQKISKDSIYLCRIK